MDFDSGRVFSADGSSYRVTDGDSVWPQTPSPTRSRPSSRAKRGRTQTAPIVQTKHQTQPVDAVCLPRDTVSQNLVKDCPLCRGVERLCQVPGITLADARLINTVGRLDDVETAIESVLGGGR